MSAEEFKKEVEQDVHNKNKLIETILAIGFLIIALGLIAYGTWNYINGSESVDFGSRLTYRKAKTTTEKSTTTAATMNTTGVKYTNSQYGFNLTLPTTWKDYGVSEILPDDASEIKTIYFGLPAKAPQTIYQTDNFNRNYNSLIAISVYTKAQWTEAQKQEGQKPTLLNQNSNYVFAYSFGNGVPNAKGFTAEQIQADEKTIIASFKFN